MRRPLACIALALTLPGTAVASGDAAKTARPPQATVRAANAPLEVADVTFVPPAAWERSTGASSMAVATYLIPDKAGDATVMFYHFGPGKGGSTDDNVARWFGQMTPEKGAPAIANARETRDVGGTAVTIARARGTFEAGMMSSLPEKGPQPGYALVGMVIESPRGPVFVKMTGPAATVDAAQDGLESLIKSIRVKT